MCEINTVIDKNKNGMTKKMDTNMKIQTKKMKILITCKPTNYGIGIVNWITFH